MKRIILQEKEDTGLLCLFDTKLQQYIPGCSFRKHLEDTEKKEILSLTNKIANQSISSIKYWIESMEDIERKFACLFLQIADDGSKASYEPHGGKRRRNRTQSLEKKPKRVKAEATPGAPKKRGRKPKNPVEEVVVKPTAMVKEKKVKAVSPKKVEPKPVKTKAVSKVKPEKATTKPKVKKEETPVAKKRGRPHGSKNKK